MVLTHQGSCMWSQVSSEACVFLRQTNWGQSVQSMTLARVRLLYLVASFVGTDFIRIGSCLCLRKTQALSALMAAQQVLLPCSLLVKTKPGRGLPKCTSLAGVKGQGLGGKTQLPVVIEKWLYYKGDDGWWGLSDQYISTLTLWMTQTLLWIYRSDI